MYGGLLKSASAVALLAAAGLYGAIPAKAADLGGDCCADLEERVAELEATTVRKGNRKVSLTISGLVAHNVMWWDDDARSDVYIGDGGNLGSRFRFVGTAKISPQLTAGFLYEFGININSISSMSQIMGVDGTANGDDLGGSVSLRDSTVWLRHSQLGMIKLGHGSTATDNLVLIDLGGLGGASTPDVALYNGGFRLLRNGIISGGTGSGISAVTWAQIIRGGETWDTTRRNHVLYETPALAGFTLQAAVAEDNYWDVALRYAGEFGGFRIAAGIGYQENTEFNHAPTTATFPAPGFTSCAPADDCEMKESQVKGSASVLHVPTGLFVTFSAGSRDIEDKTSLGVAGINRNSTSGYWHIAGGISQNFFGIGRTVLFGEYGEHNDALRVVFSDVTSSKATNWGIGVNQFIDAAAMDVFIVYKHFDAEITTTLGPITGLGDFQAVIGGARIVF
jgi:predicted porin